MTTGCGFYIRNQAKAARPVIKALNDFHAAKGKYPAQPSELASYLPKGIAVIDGLGLGEDGGFGLYGTNRSVDWYYHVNASGQGYELSCQMRDHSLVYSRDAIKSAWYLYPGDGSDDVTELHFDF